MSKQQEFICGLSHEVTIAVLPRLNMEELIFEFNRRIQNLDKENSIKDRLISILRDVMLEEYGQLERKTEESMLGRKQAIIMQKTIPKANAETLLTETTTPDASLQSSGLDIESSKENNNTSNEVLTHNKELVLNAVQVQLTSTLPSSDSSMVQMSTAVDCGIKEEEAAMMSEDEAGKACHDELNVDTPTFSLQELDTINPMGDSRIEKPMSSEWTPDYDDVHVKMDSHESEDDQIGQISLDQDRDCMTGLGNSGNKQSLRVNFEETVSCEPIATQDQDSENRMSPLSNKNLGIVCKRYVCNSCGFTTSYAHKFSKHRQRHMRGKSFICGECGYRASYKSRLVYHMRTHTGEKPFKCNQCHYQASLKGSLVEHMKKHGSREPYSCELCDYQTLRKYHFERHMKYHAGVKPYKCEECDYRTVDKDSLIRHMRCHTGERPYSCNECDYKASLKATLLRHVRKKHQ
ncbi:uncharacterized protein LOC144865645 [Branchiostoma floridae x Branchiostoma japonicum]